MAIFENRVDHIILRIFGLKINIRTNRKDIKEIRLLNKIFEDEIYRKTNCVNIPSVRNMNETMEVLLNSEKSICRYGDGEFKLIYGHDLAFQKASEELSQRLKAILIEKDENIMVGIPNKFGKLEEETPGSADFWRRFLVYNRPIIYPLLDFNKQYFDSEVSRSYMGKKDKSESKKIFDGFKKLVENKNLIIVEGKYSRLGYNNDLFSKAKSIKRILCPAQNAYSKYNEILAECKQYSKDNLFIIALGPTATILAYDLAKLGFRALDLGHVDIEYEWFLQGVTKKVPVKNKYVNESKTGKISTELNDETFEKEILKDLSE